MVLFGLALPNIVLSIHISTSCSAGELLWICLVVKKSKSPIEIYNSAGHRQPLLLQVNKKFRKFEV